MPLTSDQRSAAYAASHTSANIQSVATTIDGSTSNDELARKQNFATNTFHLKDDLQSLRATTLDSLVLGDTMFGTAGHHDIAKQVRDRNHDLKNKKDQLMKEIDRGESIINKTNRDFSDIKDALPETRPKRVLHFIEDYTLALLFMGYVFMVCISIYLYVLASTEKVTAFFQAIGVTLMFSMFMFMFLYYLC